MVQRVSTVDWTGTDTDPPWRTLLLLHNVNAIGRHLKAWETVARPRSASIDGMMIDRERLFLSHAKAGGWAIANAIENHLAARAQWCAVAHASIPRPRRMASHSLSGTTPRECMSSLTSRPSTRR
ncbi:MAG: hypothetical protein JNM75_15290 [Rhodospirillales bacterium]|nr:hypothetical protein [Rhodospirillales bacterium]